MLREVLADRRCQIVVSIITALYFFIVIIHLSPGGEYRKRITESAWLFWNYWRLDQNWNLFSPVIRDMNHHMIATVTFADGTKTVVELPRNNKLGLAGKMKDEMWRKWAGDSVPFPNYKEFRPDLARYIGRRLYRPDNPPVTLTLTWFFIKIPEPSANVAQDRLPHHTNTGAIFEYRFQPEDFK